MKKLAKLTKESNTTSKRNCSHCAGVWTKGIGDALFIIRKVNFFTGNFKGSDFY